MLRPGERTRPVKQTASLLATPFEGGGLGHTLIGGKRFDWNNYDTLAVPAGEWYEHVNESSTQPIILFVASDEPALRAFGLHKKWGRGAAGDVEKLV
jgi:gentisate 1,2-dioxygenase